MKLLALLKDSYREAVDRKIFAAMLVLSGLLTLFVASISFRQITLEEELDATASQMSYWMGFDPHLGKPAFTIENFQQTNESAEPWQRDYSFDWVVRAEAEKLKSVHFTGRWQLRQLMRDGFYYLDNIEVSNNLSKDPKEVRFKITTRGTKVTERLGWIHEPTILFAIPLRMFHTSLREAVYFIQDKLVGGIGAWVAVLVGVIVTASFIPNLLEKGAIDLMLSKPVRRPGLLIYKYVGGLVFVFLVTAVTVLGVWTALGLRSGIWAPGFLLVIPAVTFYFGLLYSVSTLAAVVSRSAVVAILLTCAAWFLLWLNGTIHGTLDGIRKAKTRAAEMAGAPAKAQEKDKDRDPDEPKEEEDTPPSWDLPRWVYTTSDVLYKSLPRTGELNRLTTRWVSEGVLTPAQIEAHKLDKAEAPAWGETVGVTGAFITVMLGLACWRFVRTDY